MDVGAQASPHSGIPSSAGRPESKTSRRGFMRASSLLVAGGAVSGGLTLARSAHAYGSDLIKLGLVGCGRRGTRVVKQLLSTNGGSIQLVAMADVFGDRIQAAYRGIKGQFSDQVMVDRDRRWTGLDAYRQLFSADVDLVVLATPPGFRPLHFAAAVQAGKHVFLEKPIAVDVPGIRRVLAAGTLATQKQLAVAVGLQRRHETGYRETIQRLQDGAIGDLLSCRAYWNSQGTRVPGRKPRHTELEFQLRNWYRFTWLGGDHVVEQHIHNLDVINWLLGSCPLEAKGQGGHPARISPDDGQVFDHHFVELTYPDGVTLFSQARQMPGCWNHVGENVLGTQGSASLDNASIYDSTGQRIWHRPGPQDGAQRQPQRFIAALRAGERPNEVEYAVTSTMTAVMARMATYSGQLVRWDDAVRSNVTLADVDNLKQLDQVPPIQPDAAGLYPLARPGDDTII